MLLSSSDSINFGSRGEKENNIENTMSPQLRTPIGSNCEHTKTDRSNISGFAAVTPGESATMITLASRGSDQSPSIIHNPKREMSVRGSANVASFISPEENEKFINRGSKVYQESCPRHMLLHDCANIAEDIEEKVYFDDEFPQCDEDSDTSFRNSIEPFETYNSCIHFNEVLTEKSKTLVTPLIHNGETRRNINSDAFSTQHDHLISGISFVNVDIKSRRKQSKRKSKKKKRLKKEKKSKKEMIIRENAGKKRKYSEDIIDEDIVISSQQSKQKQKSEGSIKYENNSGCHPTNQQHMLPRSTRKTKICYEDHYLASEKSKTPKKSSAEVYIRNDVVEEECSSCEDDGLEMPYDSPVHPSKVGGEGISWEAQGKKLEIAFSDLHILCSESFLETSSHAVTAISSRLWEAMEPSYGCQSIMLDHLRRKKITLHDSWLLDEIGIDLEVMGKKAILILRLSSLEKDVEVKAFVRNMIRLSACGRYKEIYVIIDVDILISASVSKDIAFLQSAPLGNTDCIVSFQFSTNQTIAQAIADIAIDSPSILDASTLETFIHLYQQASFLLQIASTLTVHESIFLLTGKDGKSPRSVSQILEDPDTTNTPGIQLHLAAHVSLK
jgi:hypothetical protein